MAAWSDCGLERRVKRFVARVSLCALGAAFERLHARHIELRRETASWAEGRSFALSVLPNGPSVTVRRQHGRMRAAAGLHRPGLCVYFKSLDSALLPLTAAISADDAFVQRRAVVHGSIAEAMQVARAMRVVHAMLLPGIAFWRMGAPAPRVSLRDRLDQLRLWAALPFTLAAVAFRKDFPS